MGACCSCCEDLFKSGKKSSRPLSEAEMAEAADARSRAAQAAEERAQKFEQSAVGKAARKAVVAAAAPSEQTTSREDAIAQQWKTG